MFLNKNRSTNFKCSKRNFSPAPKYARNFYKIIIINSKIPNHICIPQSCKIEIYHWFPEYSFIFHCQVHLHPFFFDYVIYGPLYTKYDAYHIYDIFVNTTKIMPKTTITVDTMTRYGYAKILITIIIMKKIPENNTKISKFF